MKFYYRNPIIKKRTIERIKKTFQYIDSVGSNLIDTAVVNPMISRITKDAIKLSYFTNGAFDPSIGIISRQWNRFKKPILPDSNRIKRLISLVDYRKILIKGDTLLPGKGQVIDLGGIAKGYALDTAIAIMKSFGIRSGLVNAGGDIKLLGKKYRKSEWMIGLQDPRDKESIIDTLKIHSCTVATSGDYERYFIIDGKRYHHLLDPKTGFPSRGCMSVTVISKNGELADGLATAIFIMGPTKGKNFMEKNNIRGIIIDSLKNEIKVGL